MGVENQLEKHREHLVLARQSSQDSYDKAILSLSGGALGISIAFIDKLAADAPLRPGLLLTSWSCWAISLILILFSHFFSHRSLTHAIAKLDRDEDE